jgi:hypothetical protein
MDIADNGEFRRRLITLAELFDAKLSPQKQALYFEALRDLPFTAVATGLNQAAKLCTFMPRPAELRTLAVGDAEDHAERAWMAFRAAMRRVGAYASLATVDPALGETITTVFGSWPGACATDLSPEMWAAKRKEFGRVYRVLVDRALVGTRYLCGLCEQQNAGRMEWGTYVPIGVIEGTEVRTLTGAEAEDYRTQVAERASGFSRLDGEEPRELPPPEGA